MRADWHGLRGTLAIPLPYIRTGDKVSWLLSCGQQSSSQVVRVSCRQAWQALSQIRVHTVPRGPAECMVLLVLLGS